MSRCGPVKESGSPNVQMGERRGLRRCISDVSPREARDRQSHFPRTSVSLPGERLLEDIADKSRSQLSSPQNVPIEHSTRGQKRKRTSSHLKEEPSQHPSDSSIQNDDVLDWLASLPHSEEMSPPSPKRRRPRSISDPTTSSARGFDHALDRSGQTNLGSRKGQSYSSPTYNTKMEKLGCFSKPSPHGPLQEDQVLCQTLIGKQHHPKPSKTKYCWTSEQLDRLFDAKTEAGINLRLHPLLVPSLEGLYAKGASKLEHLAEEYNNLWTEAIPILGPRPQPDHTVGYRYTAFTTEQWKKLDTLSEKFPLLAPEPGMYFPFLTSEIKGIEQLHIADRQNLHSAAIAVRAVVELHRKAKLEKEVHGRILGFSISHDKADIRIYAHYPEIDAYLTRYFRYLIKRFSISEDIVSQEWTAYRFTRNVYDLFASSHLERIKKAIDAIPDHSPESSRAGANDKASPSGEGTTSLSRTSRSAEKSTLASQAMSQDKIKRQPKAALLEKRKGNEEEDKRMREELGKRQEEENRRLVEENKRMREELGKRQEEEDGRVEGDHPSKEQNGSA